VKRAVLDALLRARRAKRSAALVTDLESGEQWMFEPAQAPIGLDEAVPADPRRAARDRAGRSSRGRALFVNVYEPAAAHDRDRRRAHRPAARARGRGSRASTCS
jgi:hypothetical protein